PASASNCAKTSSPTSRTARTGSTPPVGPMARSPT
ncbi:MAG: hypothetical protein AVDCRST_MAG18-4469, partial [uncultured Thermomicrobiales bacterium]